MLYVVNRYRALTQTSEEVCALLKEIESACRLTGDRRGEHSHLQAETTVDDILQGILSLKKQRSFLNLPLAFTTVPAFLAGKAKRSRGECLSSREIYVKTPLGSNNPKGSK